MGPKGFQQYKEQAVNTMTQEELLQLLYSEVVKRLMQAELALNKENYEVFDVSVERAIEIIQYLDETLDRQYEISASLTRLYEYFVYQLNRAKLGRHADMIVDIRNQLKELQETFKQAQSQLDAGKQA